MVTPESMEPLGRGSAAALEHAAGHVVTAAATLPDSQRSDSRVTSRSLRSKARTLRQNGGIHGRVITPQPRRGGVAPYVRQLALTSVPLVLADVMSLCAAIGICELLGLQWLNLQDETSRAIVWLPSIGTAWILVNAVLGLYPGVCLGLVDEIRRLSLSLTVVALITASRFRVGADWFGQRVEYLIVAYLVCMFLAPIVRSMVRKRMAKFSWWGFPTLVCGNDVAAFGVDQWLFDNRRLGLKPLGVIADARVLEVDSDSSRYLGSWEDARAVAESRNAFWAILVEPDETDRLQEGATFTIEQHLGTIPLVYIVSKLTGIPDHWDRHQMDEGLPGVMVEHHLLLPIPQLVKRGMDLAISVIAGVLLAPLFVVLAIVIKLTSRGPAFFGHQRVGFGNTRFKAWKFRTMVENAEAELETYLQKHPELRAEWESTQKLKDDPRVTPIGRWMRKWSVDELPQLWNVFVGEMSAVGPRPIVPCEIETYGEHFEIFCSVLPGMTGLWQVCGRNNTSFRERIQLGMYYVHHWSPWMDLYLLVRTVKTVLFTKGAY
jgi:Undecaprenyl-phosphate galactose phosphotransferase WbaP